MQQQELRCKQIAYVPDRCLRHVKERPEIRLHLQLDGSYTQAMEIS